MTAWDDIAVEKLTRILGDPKGRALYGEVAQAIGLASLESADDLYAFAQELCRRGGFVAAVGGLLSVQAVMGGGAPRSTAG